MKLKYSAELIAGGTPAVDDPMMWSVEPEEGTAWVAIGDMSSGKTVTETDRRISAAGIANKRLTVADAGTVLFAMYASVGAVATLGTRATWNQAILGVRPLPTNADGRFLGYWLQHIAPAAKALVRASTQDNLNAEQVANLPFTDVPLAEQRRIADFLDDQVARIDNIIAARTNQLSLVSDELDADWEEAALRFRVLVSLRRFLVSIADGPFGSALTSAHYVDNGTRVVRLGNIGLNEFRDNDKAYIDDSYATRLSQHAIGEGDVLMAGLGDDRWPLGRAVVAPADLGRAIVKADCYRLRFTDRLSNDFAAWYLSSPPARTRFAELARGSTRARLNTQLAREALVPDAAQAEQQGAVKTFAVAKAVADRQASDLARSVALLTDLKQSLITAAVTGELDVSTADGSRVPV